MTFGDQIATLVKDATAAINASTVAAQGQAQLAGQYANNDTDAPIVGATDTTSRGGQSSGQTPRSCASRVCRITIRAILAVISCQLRLSWRLDRLELVQTLW